VNSRLLSTMGCVCKCSCIVLPSVRCVHRVRMRTCECVAACVRARINTHMLPGAHPEYFAVGPKYIVLVLLGEGQVLAVAVGRQVSPARGTSEQASKRGARILVSLGRTLSCRAVTRKRAPPPLAVLLCLTVALVAPAVDTGVLCTYSDIPRSEEDAEEEALDDIIPRLWEELLGDSRDGTFER
jgi:hypothetical protein